MNTQISHLIHFVQLFDNFNFKKKNKSSSKQSSEHAFEDEINDENLKFNQEVDKQ